MQCPPLANHVLFQTRELDVARERVAQKFCSHRLDISGDRSAFRAAHHHVAGQLVWLNYIAYGADVLIDPGELQDFYLVQIPIAGGATIRNGRRQFFTDGRTASVLNPHWPTRMQWWQGCRQILLQIPKTPFLAFAEQALGRALPAPLSFEPAIDLGRPELAAWRRQVAALFQAAEPPAGRQPGLTALLNEQQLLHGLIDHQPHDMSALAGGMRAVHLPRHMRRAEAFIRENAARPITILDIAEAAGVTSRTLQLAFKSAYGLSPMRALAGERLRRVRRELLYGDDTESVAEAATRWGFSHLGRFSSAYKAEFGELPNETRRARLAG